MANLDSVWAALAEVMDPELNRSIVDVGMVHELALEDGVVSFTLALTTIACPLRGQLTSAARERLLSLQGIKEVRIAVREMTPEEKRAALAHLSGEQGDEGEGSAAASHNRIRHVIAVLSGKGGVGKSSVAALLAVALRRRGHAVGLLDADITGPSIPKMLLADESRPLMSPLGIVPVQSRGGIRIMSINLLLENPNQAVIWRGPLISGAIKQFWSDVHWGDLDYLLVDLPPGTSDASLTVMQTIPLNGVLLVTTPQSLAGMVVRKAASMASQLGIPVLGLVENMSYVRCPHCGQVIEAFGPSTAAELAQAMGIPLLSRLGVDPELARLGDNGRLEEYAAEEFDALAGKLLAPVSESACGGAPV